MERNCYNSSPAAAVFVELQAIALRCLQIPTLADRRSDRLDFHEVGVGCLTDALYEAYLLGVRSASPGGATDPPG
ncbi:DUF6900 domain-containing protein [Rhodoferax sp.]|uniref:DUF6900 domain-containing protein n=1 Tax=Rhodoferax sp. TaxID=50421 RepID=UPI0039B9C494